MNGKHRGNGITSKVRKSKYTAQYDRTHKNRKRKLAKHIKNFPNDKKAERDLTRISLQRPY